MHLKNVDFINIHASIFIIHAAYFIRAKLRLNWQCFVCIWIVECSFSGTCTPWLWTLAVDHSSCCQIFSHSKLPSTTYSISLLTIVYSHARWPQNVSQIPAHLFSRSSSVSILCRGEAIIFAMVYKPFRILCNLLGMTRNAVFFPLSVFLT